LAVFRKEGRESKRERLIKGKTKTKILLTLRKEEPCLPDPYAPKKGVMTNSVSYGRGKDERKSFRLTRGGERAGKGGIFKSFSRASFEF